MEKTEQLKSILTDLDNKELTKHQAHNLICVLFSVVGQSEQLCTCKNPKINDMRWSCDKCDKDFDNRYKGA